MRWSFLCSSISFYISVLILPASHSWKCVPKFSGSRICQYGTFASVGTISQSFVYLGSVTLCTCWIDCSAWTIHTLDVYGLCSDSSLTALWRGFVCVILHCIKIGIDLLHYQVQYKSFQTIQAYCVCCPHFALRWLNKMELKKTPPAPAFLVMKRHHRCGQTWWV